LEFKNKNKDRLRGNDSETRQRRLTRDEDEVADDSKSRGDGKMRGRRLSSRGGNEPAEGSQKMTRSSTDVGYVQREERNVSTDE